MGEVGSHEIRIDDAALLVTFPTAEEEHAVSADRTAEGEPELAPLKERIRISGIAVQRGIGG